MWTDRLLLRPMRLEDAVSLAARRSEPAVARFQNWIVPYPIEKAEELVADVAAMEGPENERWWMVAIVDPAAEEPVGDLVVHMTWEMRSAEIGYTLGSRHWGKGYATEAAQALIEFLFTDPSVTRISASLHPDNIASAMVLERLGFVFEGHTRLSFWVGADNSDDWLYGMTRADWRSWNTTPRNRPDGVQLVAIDHTNMRDVAALRTHKSQERFVAPVLMSYANALYPEPDDDGPVEPWLRAVHADGELVGFVMLAARTEHQPEPYLWRMLIDRLHQRRGIGSMVLDQVVDACKRMRASSLLVSYGEGKGSPGPFYLSHGFVPTGEMQSSEVVARLTF